MNTNASHRYTKYHYLSSIALYGTATLTLCIISWLLTQCYYGLDLTDESFYLNWMANPWIYKTSIFQFGFIYHPLHLLTHGHIAQLRQINILILFGLSWALFFLFFKTTSTVAEHSTPWHSKSMIILAASLATSAFAYCCPFGWLVTPSYNSLIFQSLLIAGIGALLAEKTGSKASVTGWVLIGLAGWLSFMAKPSSAAALFVVMGGYLIIAGKFNPKLLLICLFTTTALFFLSAWCIDGSITMFIKRHIVGFENFKLLRLKNKLFRIDQLTLNQQEKYFIFIGTFILTAVLYFTASTKKYATAIHYGVTSILLLISFLIIFNLLPIFMTADSFSTIQIIIIPFSALLISIAILGRNFLNHISRNHLALMFLFLAFPYVCAFGTGNNYWLQSQLAGCFWILAGLTLLMPAITATSKWTLLLPIALGTQLLTCLLLQVAMEHPYRQNQPLHQFHNKTAIESTHSTLMFNEANSNFYHHIQTEMKRVGFIPNTPVIDLTGQSPGILYIINGKAIGQPWMLGGYPGSDNFTLASLNSISCKEMRKAWLLIESESPTKITPSILNHFGINVEKDYIAATEFTFPLIVGESQRKQKLLRPIRTTQEARTACNAAANN